MGLKKLSNFLRGQQQYAPLLVMFSSQGQSELILLQKVQEYCYDNIHFMKAFQKIVVLFYKGIRPRWSASVRPLSVAAL